ncbi:MAG: Ig-like domain-containing protein [Ruminiclostridium sp.]|nr:Ig-like domain-containing protein [Ruminiclostridium sp.]
MKQTLHCAELNNTNKPDIGKARPKKKRLFRTFATLTAYVIITLCTIISLCCCHAIPQTNNGNPVSAQPEESPSRTSREPAKPSLSVSNSISDDFTRTLTVLCSNTDGTTEGLLCYICQQDATAPDNYDEWIEADSGTVSVQLSAGRYNVYLSNRYGKDIASDTINIVVDAVTSVKINTADPYMNVGMYNILTVSLETVGIPDETLLWKSGNSEVATVKDGLVTAVGEGRTTITVSTSNGISDSLDIIVTDLLRAPQITEYKPLLPPQQYNETEGAIIDAVLESRVATAGYGTRAGVVAAARFIPLEFKYKIPYFYENGRLDAKPNRPVCDGEGRFYHIGLYLTHSKFDELDKSKILYGPATWGEPLTNWEDAFGLIPGAQYSNGMDCSGFISWCFLNGGVPLGDIGAGETPDYEKEYSDIGERVMLDEEFMRSGRLQVGDTIGCDGHIALVVGFDEENIYIAESLGNGITIEVRERYREVWENGEYTYAMLLDDIYNKHGGKGNITEIWKDYSDTAN